MKRLLLAAGMALIIHALLLGAEAEWMKTRSARKSLPEPLSISLQYRETPAAVTQKERPALTLPTPPRILPTPPAPEALDAPETPAFKVPVKTPKKKQARVESPKSQPQKKRKEVANPAATMEELPRDWMQIPESPTSPAEEGAQATASIAPAKESAGATPQRPKQAAPAPPPPPLVEATPMYRKNPAPLYPRVARRRGYEGKVVLDVLVNEEGRVEDLRVFQSSGHTVLDRSAIKAVHGWLFEPGRRGDEKVAMWVKVPIRFDLR